MASMSCSGWCGAPWLLLPSPRARPGGDSCSASAASFCLPGGGKSWPNLRCGRRLVNTPYRTCKLRRFSATISLRADAHLVGGRGRSRIVTKCSQSGDGGNAGPEEEREASDNAGGDADEGDVSRSSSEGPSPATRNAVFSAFRQFWEDFSRELKNETGFDSEAAWSRAQKFGGDAKENSWKLFAATRDDMRIKVEGITEKIATADGKFRSRYWPQFVEWNRKELWQDKAQWDTQRVGVFVFYVLLFGALLRGAHVVVTSHRNRKSVEAYADAFLANVIPEATPEQVREVRRAQWREVMPEGLDIAKYKLDEDGKYKRDEWFPGDQEIQTAEESEVNAKAEGDGSETVVADSQQGSKVVTKVEQIDEQGRVKARVNMDEFINSLDAISAEDKEKVKKEIVDVEDLQAGKGRQPTIGERQDTTATGIGTTKDLQERVMEWKLRLEEERLKEMVDSDTSAYVMDRASLSRSAQIESAKEEMARDEPPMQAFWVARKWWKFRPSLPYTYFLDKIEDDEVKAAVFTEDMTKLYVTMKEGFPDEYVVDVPVDASLHELLCTHDVEVDFLHRSNLYYLGRLVLVLAPSLYIIWYIRELQYQAKAKASEKIYDLLSMNRQHLILPEDAAERAKSQYKDVVIGGDVWQVINEIMIYMKNPMKYHNNRTKLPRGILISGPPGTGKTLLARAIARESGLPFIFASGAEFVESGTGTGTDKVFDIFFTARANAPSFIFIDEIDALAGKNAKDDAERRATFEQLLSELDAEPEDTDVDRFAERQAVILICATNRPDELNEEFMRPGRIDREIHVGLPGEQERVGIFRVHSQGKRIAADVDFTKLAFRTIGYSGADIRNLINEAGIMAVRKGHDEISQQDLVDVLDKQLFEGMGVVLMDEEQKRAEEKIPEENKKLLAIHEAGHVLLAHLFPRFDWHAFSHLLPGGSESALSVFYPRQEMLQMGHTTIGYVKMQMVVAHGGRCAERLLVGENISDGGQDDLQRISAMARELTISPTNKRLGLLPVRGRQTFDPPKLPGEVELIPREWDKPGTEIMNMSVELSELFTREVTQFVEETEEIALKAMTENRQILQDLADLLLQKTKLSGFEAEDFIRSRNPVLLPDFMEGPKVDLKSFEEVKDVTSLRRAGRYEELNIYPAPLHQS